MRRHWPILLTACWTYSVKRCRTLRYRSNSNWDHCIPPRNIFITYRRPSGEKRSLRKCYAIDPAFITNHEDFLQTPNLGWRLENVVAVELMRRMNSEIEQLFYLRKHKSFEVDFVRTKMGHVEELIQVTYNFQDPTVKLYNREVGGLLKGAASTKCQNLTLIMMDGEERVIEQDGYSINCVLAVNWFLG